MAGIPIHLGTGNGGQAFTRISCFLKVNTMLTHNTALVDLDLGLTGYLRLSWKPDALLIAEVNWRGHPLLVNLWGSSASMQANAWHWISASAGNTGNGGELVLFGQVWRPDGTTPGRQVASVGNLLRQQDVVDAGLGWGVPLSSGYNYFPFAVGDEMTELCVETGAHTAPNPLTPPIAPMSPGDSLVPLPGGGTAACIVALYHCAEPLGINRVIHDATTNQYDLQPAPTQPGAAGGNQVLVDSPF
jgi:hypothetical protein